MMDLAEFLGPVLLDARDAKSVLEVFASYEE